MTMEKLESRTLAIALIGIMLVGYAMDKASGTILLLGISMLAYNAVYLTFLKFVLQKPVY